MTWRPRLWVFLCYTACKCVQGGWCLCTSVVLSLWVAMPCTVLDKDTSGTWVILQTYLNMPSFFAVINFIYIHPPNRTGSLLSSGIWVATYFQDLQRDIFQKAARICPVIYYVILCFT